MNLFNTFKLISTLLGGFFLIYIVFELISGCIVKIFFPDNNTSEITRGTLLDSAFEQPDSYAINNDWYKEYCIEAKKIFANPKWKPLGLWSAPRFHGQYINVDKYNLRRTIQDNGIMKPSDHSGMNVAFYGGSTVWGWGSRDSHTLPSELFSLNPNFSVRNYGELGYVSSQELIAFIESLKTGSKPDLIIFVDGLNDMFSAYQAGIAGIEQNAVFRKQSFETRNKKSLLEEIKDKSNIKALVSKFSKPMRLKSSVPMNSMLAESIIAVYNKNVEIISNLAKSYDIQAIFIWQPVLFDKPRMTLYERKIHSIIAEWQPLHTLVKNHITGTHNLDPRVIDMTDCFVEETGPIFIDPWHYNECANKILAKKIDDVIRLKINTQSMGSNAKRYFSVNLDTCT